MRRPLAALFGAAIIVTVVLSCTADRPAAPGEPSAPPELNRITIPPATQQIAVLFQIGQGEILAHARYLAIRRLAASPRGLPAAREATANFIQWMLALERLGALRDPNGSAPPTTSEAVATLAATLLSEVYPDEPPPADLGERDGAVIVIGDGGDSTGIRTPSRHAAGSFPAGSLLPGTVVTLYKVPQTTPGAGPLPTDQPQYGPFYQFDVFPEQHVGADVVVAVCQVTDPSSPFYAPDAVHDRLRLAKPSHDDPSTLYVLERVDIGTLVLCDDVRADVAVRDAGDHSALAVAKRLAGRALGVFTPTPAYAVHLGLGGRVTVAAAEGFSPIGAVLLPPESHNQDPTARAGGPYAGRVEGQSIAFDGSASSDPDGDELTFHWSFGDGTPSVHGATTSHVYVDNGLYAASLTASDGKGGSHVDLTNVTVANAAPVVKTVKLTAPTLNMPRAGQMWSVGWVFTDAGTNDAPWSWSIAWGDGTTSNGTASTAGEVYTTHAYATPGARTVTFRVTDKDGGSASRSIPVSVLP